MLWQLWFQLSNKAPGIHDSELLLILVVHRFLIIPLLESPRSKSFRLCTKHVIELSNMPRSSLILFTSFIGLLYVSTCLYF